MPPALRRLMLVVHVVCSVGWLGAVATSLALAVIGVTADGDRVRAAYLTLEPLGWYVLIPLSQALADPSPVLHSAAAVILLVVATVLSIYKPRGLTAYGQRRQMLRSPQRLDGTADLPVQS